MSGRVLAITGGRYDGTRRPLIPSRHQLTSLWRLIQLLGVTVVVHGDAIGTDKQVALFIRFRTVFSGIETPQQIEVRAYPIDPTLDGRHRGAGNNRNGRMLRDSGARYLAALPGATGTADCTRKAKEMGLEVWEWRGGRDDGQFVKTADRRRE